jgi:hypothetical protein
LSCLVLSCLVLSCLVLSCRPWLWRSHALSVGFGCLALPHRKLCVQACLEALPPSTLSSLVLPPSMLSPSLVLPASKLLPHMVACGGGCLYLPLSASICLYLLAHMRSSGWRREQGTSYDNDEYLLPGMSIPEKLRIQSGALSAAFVKGQFYSPSLFAPHPGLALSRSPLLAPSACSLCVLHPVGPTSLLYLRTFFGECGHRRVEPHEAERALERATTRASKRVDHVSAGHEAQH